ncbi:MAG TPA: hypothetical protein VGI39_44385, partial [Polyangiaceae bacterium]
MRGIFGAFAFAVVGGTIVACGGSAPPAQTAGTGASAAEPAAAPANAAAESTGTAGSAMKAPPPTAVAQVADPPLDDPNERSGPISMPPQFGKEKAKKSFPKK